MFTQEISCYTFLKMVVFKISKTVTQFSSNYSWYHINISSSGDFEPMTLMSFYLVYYNVRLALNTVS